jgi:ribosome-associated protein
VFGGGTCVRGVSLVETIEIRDDFIKLGQAMKLAGLVENGGEAKDIIAAGEVLVNGEVDLRRGRKLYKGDIFSYNGTDVKVD